MGLFLSTLNSNPILAITISLIVVIVAIVARTMVGFGADIPHYGEE